MNKNENSQAWGLPRVLDYFDTARSKTEMVYPSEWIFLRDLMYEGMSVLDVGCAQGGFANVLGEHLNSFSYTGVDINPGMIARAQNKHPTHTFYCIEEADFKPLKDSQFDLVLVLGILHLHEAWRDTLAQAWSHTSGHLLFDLRESPNPTIEDKKKSFFRMDFHGQDKIYRETRLPYNVINSSEALETIVGTCSGAGRVSHYGYFHPVSHVAECPYEQVMANSYCIER